MKRLLRGIYFFLPVQLLLLHFRKYQLLLLFWLILLLTITGKFASHFGASSLFLAPEYLGDINFVSMLLLGGSLCVFTMMWNITTFIAHSKRIPYMGASRHAFLVYCLNNFLIPLSFLVFYSCICIHFQWHDEHYPVKDIVFLQLGFYIGYILVLLVSFAYFFRISRDFFKNILVKITKSTRVHKLIPYDSLDYEIDIIPAHSYISGRLMVERSTDADVYHPRIMNKVLSRHHRNVIFATLILYFLLLLMGVFMEQPLLRVPAGAGFLLLFSIVMGVVGAFKYFLRSWETIGWVIFVVLLITMVNYKLFDLRSIAYGLNYHTSNTTEPEYTYEHLRALFDGKRYEADKQTEIERLKKWKSKTGSANPPLIVITSSGGGSRSAYWTFRALQYADSVTGGKLFENAVLMTGASGGMLGAAYWRSIHDAGQRGFITKPYERKFQDNIGKDLLNAIIFSFASVDLVSPFNKISLAGYSYTRDRGYAMEQELVRNSEGLLDKNIGYFKKREADGYIPQLIINGTIINDGRQLIISNQPAGYLTQPTHSIHDTLPAIDAVDFATLFTAQDPYNLRLTSALRMNATFPFVLPVVRLPSQPVMNIMDAGLRDNFGAELATRYLFVMKDWLAQNVGDIIFLEVRDSKENDVTDISDQSSSLGKMIFDPLFVIQNKWESFQSYSHGFLKDYAPACLNGKLHYVTLQYLPKESKKVAALNFHLTQNEKEDLYESMNNRDNQQAIDSLMRYVK